MQMNRKPAGRHYCSECGSRVFPGDTFEALTESPNGGKRGQPILLSSANGRRRENQDALLAYCWAQKKWVETYHKDKYDLLVEYAQRRGVTFHFNGQVGAVGKKISERSFARRLEERTTRGSGTMS